MLARARAEAGSERITYKQADLETLTLPEAAFDLAYSALVLHYVENLGRLFSTVHRALVPGGQFVFSIEHPIYMAPERPADRGKAGIRRRALLIAATRR
jgi:predicted TPR repeat methyltransferase